MKKLVVMVFISLVLIGTLAAGGGRDAGRRPAGELTAETVRLAFIHVGDTADRGYTYRQHRGTEDMMSDLGISAGQVRNFWNISPGAAADTAILEAIEWGADMIFATSFGHGPHMLEAAQDHPYIRFFHATGNLATAAGLPNFHNYFGNMTQARYLSGIAAGKRTQSNILGFVRLIPMPKLSPGLPRFLWARNRLTPMSVCMLCSWACGITPHWKPSLPRRLLTVERT